MNKEIYKFPITPHLTVLGQTVIRDDKVMSKQEVDEFLSHELVVEEKVDGANLGISFDSSGSLKRQNRGAYLEAPFTGQWKKLPEWLLPKTDLFLDVLSDQYILFGEWCYAQHSVYYDQLSDWFLGFDVFDKNEQRFFSSQRRDSMFQRLGICQTPFIARGHFSFETLGTLFSKSLLSEEPSEGLYLRYDDGDWLGQRAKLVRSQFVQNIEKHWTRGGIRPNRLIHRISGSEKIDGGISA
ncbi:MAG: RNA ligase family protein [Syntrophaceae bacterium]|nr:RNA ligase family protein [Syntrophaceae bacterium]